MDLLEVLALVAKAEGWKYNSRSFTWVIVMLFDDAEVMLQLWVCSSAATLAALY